MKTMLVSAAVGLMAFGAASNASAYYFTPKNTTIQATGSVTVAGHTTLVCGTDMTLQTTPAVTVTAVTFKGPNCGGMVATGLPWHLGDRGPHAFAISGFGLMSTANGTCGPNTVPGGLSINGKMSFAGVAVRPCSLTGTLETSPRLTISGKANPN